eukprot:scaffold52542_cov40-Phaeocystis_antarctica.AAC.2
MFARGCAAAISTAAPQETGPEFAAFQQNLMSVLKGSGTLDTLKAHRTTPPNTPPARASARPPRGRGQASGLAAGLGAAVQGAFAAAARRRLPGA